MSDLKRHIKRDALLTDFQKTSAKLIIVWGYFCLFCEMRKLRCVLTSIMDGAANRKTKTHPDGRAFDASIIGWTDQDIIDCIDFMKKNINELGAISSKSKEREVVDCHGENENRHLHFQVSRGV